jgi:hypothetical protein
MVVLGVGLLVADRCLFIVVVLIITSNDKSSQIFNQNLMEMHFMRNASIGAKTAKEIAGKSTGSERSADTGRAVSADCRAKGKWKGD